MTRKMMMMMMVMMLMMMKRVSSTDLKRLRRTMPVQLSTVKQFHDKWLC